MLHSWNVPLLPRLFVVLGWTVPLGDDFKTTHRLWSSVGLYVPGGCQFCHLRGCLAANPASCHYALAGVSIAIMGCIVNGPGEMADADFG